MIEQKNLNHPLHVNLKLVINTTKGDLRIANYWNIVDTRIEMIEGNLALFHENCKEFSVQNIRAT